MPAIPITIVSGFLGAGKTTLLERLLTGASQRLAVLVNDFAALNIDAALIESAAPERIALTNGCVCCTLRADLAAAALELAGASPPPQRIVVETSGVAEPYGVMEALLLPEVVERVFVESCVCVVDALQFPELDYASGELAIDQAAVADFVLLNKCDLVSDAHIARVEATLRGALPAMRIHRTSYAAIDPEVVFGVSEHHAPKSAAHHHADYASFAWSCDEPLELDAFERLVDDLPHAVLRGKGILQFAEHRDERGVFHRVGKRSTLTFEAGANSSSSRLVLIGPRAEFDVEHVRRLVCSLGGAEVR